MPEYSYVCDKEHRQWDNNTGCGYEFSIVCSVKKYISSPECPQCKRDDAVVRDYRQDNVNVGVTLGDTEITVGHMANRNTEKLSTDQKISIYNKHNAYRFQESKVKLGKNMKSYGKLGERVDKLPTGNMRKKRPINKRKKEK